MKPSACGRILRARFTLSRPDRGKCSLLWNSGQSGRTPSWMQAFTGPFERPRRIQASVREVNDEQLQRRR